MPLASIASVYKNFPEHFADRVSKHVKTRAECYKDGINSGETRTGNDETNGATNATKRTKFAKLTISGQKCMQPIPSPDIEPLKTKRYEVPLAMPSDGDSEPDNHSNPYHLVTPPTSARGPSPSSGRSRPGSGSSRLPQKSPRITVSLDNVDLWEESDLESIADDSESNTLTFDLLNEASINPSKTFDFSELRRSHSPIDNKRNMVCVNKHNNAIPKITKTEKIAIKTRVGEISPREYRGFKPKARLARRMKNMFPDAERSRDGPMKHNNETLPHPLTHIPVDGKLLHRPTSVQKQKQKERQRTIALPQTDSSISSKPHTHLPDVTHKGHVRNNSDTLPGVAPKGHVRNKSDSKIPKTIAKRIELSVQNAEISKQKSRSETSLPKPEPSRPIPIRKIQETMSVENSDLSSSPSERKVKFNNFVTVRDGKMSTYNNLRNSNNSASFYKQKYLPQNYSSESNYKETTESRDDNWNFELVC